MRKTPTMRALETTHEKPIEVILIDTVNEQGSISRAAEALGLDYTTVSKWLAVFDIETRTIATLAKAS